MTFTGLPADFFVFFNDLKANNDRDWFAANKERYEKSVKEPLQDFITAMAPKLKEISPEFIADPRGNGGSMFRIYRDTRFSKDKSPYKTHAGVQFRHRAGRDAHAPGFYLHLDGPENSFCGAGLWMPPSDNLFKIRTHITEQSREWKAVFADKALAKRFGGLRDGEALKRAPKGFDPEHEFVEDLKRKSFFVSGNLTGAHFHDAQFVDEVAAIYSDAAPLMRFLTEAVGVAY